VGVSFTTDEEEDYLHAWLIVGVWLGIEPSLLPRDYAEGRALGEYFRERHHGPSEAGRVMTRALIDHLEDIVPGRMFDGFVSVMVRRMLDDRIAEFLDVPEEDWTRVLFLPFYGATMLADRLGDRSALVAQAIDKFSRAILHLTAQGMHGGETMHFHVPETLSAAWGLSDD
jgi:hypothetical protein